MDDGRLQQQFEALTLPFEQWTHRAHVRIACLYLRQFGYDAALVRLRDAIRAYNAHNNVPESETSGYNETTTVAFLRIIHATLRAYEPVMPTGTSEQFCDMHPHLMHRQVLRLFYSPQRRMHPDAKQAFVEPDLTALP